MSIKPNRAMVLAAGLGKRMREYNDRVPKPLVEVAGKPLIDWSLDLLAESGIREAVVNISYMADMVQEHVKTRSRPVVHLSHEETPLETGGGILQALPLLGDAPFFVLNSDVICCNGPSGALLDKLAAHWDDEAMDALLLLTPVETASGYSGRGDFTISADGALRRRGANEDAPYIFSGIQLLHPRFFEHAPPERAFSMNVLYDHHIGDNRTLHRVKGIIHDGVWLHVGNAEGVHSAEARLRGASCQQA